MPSSSAKTAAASATARCASSTSWPSTPAPRWGSGGLCVLRSAARALRQRHGGPARSPYVLVNECSPNGGQRGRSCHGSLPRVEPKCRPVATRTRARPTGYAAATPLPPPMLPPRTTAARDPALDLHGAPVSFATGGASPVTALNFPPFMAAPFELKLGLIQTQMAQKPMLRTEVYARALRASQNAKGIHRAL